MKHEQQKKELLQRITVTRAALEALKHNDQLEKDREALIRLMLDDGDKFLDFDGCTAKVTETTRNSLDKASVLLKNLTAEQLAAVLSNAPINAATLKLLESINPKAAKKIVMESKTESVTVSAPKSTEQKERQKGAIMAAQIEMVRDVNARIDAYFESTGEKVPAKIHLPEPEESE